MPRDTQIFSGADHAGNSDYTLPGNSEIEVLAVNANFKDNGAGADWCPAVVMFSDSGHVIARAMLPDVKVTAGGDAEVSFFPGVKPGGASHLTAPLQQSYTVTGQVIPSGAVTPITFDAGSIYNATSSPLTGSGSPFGNFAAVWPCVITLTVEWPAGVYDRYIEIEDPSFASSAAPVDWRVRHSSSPEGDIQTVTAVMAGNPFGGFPVNFNAFQASGGPLTILRWLSAQAIPRIPGQLYV